MSIFLCGIIIFHLCPAISNKYKKEGIFCYFLLFLPLKLILSIHMCKISLIFLSNSWIWRRNYITKSKIINLLVGRSAFGLSERSGYDVVKVLESSKEFTVFRNHEQCKTEICGFSIPISRISMWQKHKDLEHSKCESSAV